MSNNDEQKKPAGRAEKDKTRRQPDRQAAGKTG